MSESKEILEELKLCMDLLKLIDGDNSFKNHNIRQDFRNNIIMQINHILTSTKYKENHGFYRYK